MDNNYAFEVTKEIYEALLIISDDTGLSPDEVLRSFVLSSVLDYMKNRAKIKG